MSVPAKYPTSSALQQEVEALAKEEALSEWEREFARYLARRPKQRLAQQAKVASRLAGTTISPADVRQLRYKPEFQDIKSQELEKSGYYEKAGSRKSKKLLPMGADLTKMALEKARIEMTTGDAMGAIRAVTPLLSAIMDRNLPKKVELNALPVINLNFSAAQTVAAQQPEHVVEAEEVEVIHDEEMGT